ncbi:hypothetical protein [Flavobacterium sp.]|uniref:hypothetical protein n=1 Tax=Flavobacterium sp. TaxID=239 RepID=UPI00262620B7|nr:hypothetical protein [Flavobacterium sp.]
MPKPILIVTHGMGSDNKKSFETQIIEAFQNAYNEYPSLKNRDFRDIFDIQVVEYSSIFEEHRKKIAEDAAKIAGVIKAIPKQDDVSNITNWFVKAATEFGDDKFFYTHLLDVLFYRFTVLGELCRIRLGNEIIKAVTERGSTYVHVMGYSLGTSVLHDTLASLYSDNLKINGNALSPETNRLSSIHMVANVSRLLETFVNVDSSIVRPNNGCANYYREYRHKFDPFTWVRPFDPSPEAPWTSSGYEITEISEITQFNTHDLSHYIKNPKVHRKLISFFDAGFFPTKVEQQKADQSFEKLTIVDAYKNVASKANEIKLDNGDSIKSLFKAVRDFKEMIEDLGGDFTKEGE